MTWGDSVTQGFTPTWPWPTVFIVCMDDSDYTMGVPVIPTISAPPKHWRWFDVFRVVSQAFGSGWNFLGIFCERRHRSQQPVDRCHVRREKRKRFVQQLRTA